MSDLEFLTAHEGHDLRETFTRGLACSTCGDAQYPGNGPRALPIAPNPNPVRLGSAPEITIDWAEMDTTVMP